MRRSPPTWSFDVVTGKPECVWPLGAELGEGLVWCVRDQALWFVDIKGRRIHRLHPESGERSSWDAPQQVGFVLPSDDGGFVAGLTTGLHRFDPASGAFTPWLTVEPDRPGNRLNDAGVDDAGRLWFGSMDDAEASPTGALYRLTPGGGIDRMEDGIVITNGPAFSPDGRTFHHTDTLKRTIWAYDADAHGGLSNKRVFSTFEGLGGNPDGTVIDAAGSLWVGQFGGWGLQRLSASGEAQGRVALPCANVTKGAFGGPELKTLYITTARHTLDSEARRAQPLAGGLFAVEVETPGRAMAEVRV